MNTSLEGIKLLHHFESLRLIAYPDPGSHDGHPWTIGWGHTGPEVRKGLVWTKEQADAAFAARLAKEFEPGVLAAVTVELQQYEFDALVSFVYNIGLGEFRKSTLLRKLNAGDKDGAALEFDRWIRNDGKIMRGLVRRRAAEKYVFDGMTADEALIMAQGVA